jgi:hypothetical protein
LADPGARQLHDFGLSADPPDPMAPPAPVVDAVVDAVPLVIPAPPEPVAGPPPPDVDDDVVPPPEPLVPPLPPAPVVGPPSVHASSVVQSADQLQVVAERPEQLDGTPLVWFNFIKVVICARDVNVGSFANETNELSPCGDMQM